MSCNFHIHNARQAIHDQVRQLNRVLFDAECWYGGGMTTYVLL